MLFFTPKPNLADSEKAKVEFFLQQIAECIGFERVQLPILNREELLSLSGNDPGRVAESIARHLSHDVSGLTINVVPEVLEKCGGGG